MNYTSKFLLACIPALALSACGGGDVQDRLDVADPAVRFVDASEAAPNLTLYRDTVAQSDATNVSYLYASDYFDVNDGTADWTVKSAAAGTTIDVMSFDPDRGTKYTIVALPTSAVNTGVYLIADPYNKPIGSDSTRLRVMNARYDGGSIDLYMNAPGTDIATPGVNPLIGGTAYKNSGPASGTDSVDIPSGNYHLTITASGSKVVLFRGQIGFGDSEDILLVVLPDALTVGNVKTLIKVEGTAGMTQVPSL